MATPLLQQARAASHRFGVRLVAAVLAVSVPLMIVIAVVLTAQATHSLTSAAERHDQTVARAVAIHVEEWLSERQDDLAILAARASGRLLGDPANSALASQIDKTSGAFTLLEVTDLTGTVVASSRPGTTEKSAGLDWFATAASGQSSVTSLTEQGGHIQWILARPVLGVDGRPEGVTVGYLDVAVLSVLLNPELDHNTDVSVGRSWPGTGPASYWLRSAACGYALSSS